MYLGTKFTATLSYTGVRYGGKNEISHLHYFVNFPYVMNEIASDVVHKSIVVMTDSIAR